MQNDTPPTHRNLTVPMTTDLRDRLNERASAAGLTPAAFVRFHVIRLLDERDAAAAITTNTSEQ